MWNKNDRFFLKTQIYFTVFQKNTRKNISKSIKKPLNSQINKKIKTRSLKV